MVRRRVRPAPEGCGGSRRGCGATVGAVRGDPWRTTPQVWRTSGRCWRTPAGAYPREGPRRNALPGLCATRSSRPRRNRRRISTQPPRSARRWEVRGTAHKRDPAGGIRRRRRRSPPLVFFGRQESGIEKAHCTSQYWDFGDSSPVQSKWAKIFLLGTSCVVLEQHRNCAPQIH